MDDLRLLLWDDDEDCLLLNLSESAFDDRIYSKDFSVENFSAGACLSSFRFQKDDISKLKTELGIPNKFVCTNGTALSGTEALCVLLRRLAYPNRLYDLTEVFSRPISEISYIANAMTDFIYDNFNHLLSNFNRQWLSPENLKTYSEVIQNAGSPVPNCWGFIDGTVRPIFRPSTDQRLLYNGHKRVHSMKFQSVVTPNGLIANLYGPIEGKRHDSGMLRESGLLDNLRTHMTMADGSVFCLYGDPAYPLNQYMLSPFKGPNLSDMEQQFNEKMSAVRVSVELMFGNLINKFAFVDFKKNKKLHLQPVGKYYCVSAIFNNCHACIYGNNVSEMFGLLPPTMHDYLHG